MFVQDFVEKLVVDVVGSREPDFVLPPESGEISPLYVYTLGNKTVIVSQREDGMILKSAFILAADGNAYVIDEDYIFYRKDAHNDTEVLLEDIIDFL